MCNIYIVPHLDITGGSSKFDTFVNGEFYTILCQHRLILTSTHLMGAHIAKRQKYDESCHTLTWSKVSLRIT